jgi:Cof subfamily protein (haloacid dehalogenase superfamily)
MKGTIALDIDGTVTASHTSISQETIACLTELSKAGWDIAFITGRPFFHCVQILQPITFPFYVAPQNGAILIKMPERQILKKRYLTKDILPVMDEICDEEGTDYAVYSGMENHDSVFFRANRFSSEMVEYLTRRTREFIEDWQRVASFERLGQPEFASVKCFTLAGEGERLAEKMRKRLSLNVPVIIDPFDANYRVLQGTRSDVTKGQAVRDLLQLRNSYNLPVIAAGDDNNDIPLLEAATHPIVMASAPKAMHALACMIAPPATEQGLVTALEQVIESI